MPFGDGMFDRVIAAGVLEHVLDDQRAMNELARVLRPTAGWRRSRCRAGCRNGSAGPCPPEYHEVPGGAAMRIYARVELEAKLAQAELHVRDGTTTHTACTPRTGG